MPASATIRRPVVSAIAATWRFFRRCLRWLRRKWWKIAVWLITLTALAWQYENWHGRRELAEQRALWKAEYGDMKQSDLAPPRIPDDENFFAAPVFEKFATFLSNSGPAAKTEQENPRDEFNRRIQEAAEHIPHARFLRLQFPGIDTSSEDVPDIRTGEGLEVLDVAAWAQKASGTAKARPAGLTDSQWLYSTFPSDEIVEGFIAALSRRKASLLPNAADRWKVGEQLGNPWASPIPAMTNMFGNSRALAFRARSAARAGDRLSARQLNEVLWLLTEGLGNGATLVGTLVSIAVEGMAESATIEGLASRCWNDTDLAILSDRLAALDEDRFVLASLFQEGFAPHLWSGGPLPIFQTSFIALGTKDSWSANAYFWMLINGPRGWEDANLAWHLRLWRLLLVPDSPGDDLLALKQKVDTGLAEVRHITKTAFVSKYWASPRQIWALIVMPAMTNIAGPALDAQTRRRQLLLAIAIERYALAHGALPQNPEQLVPAFLPAIPNDPHQPGAPLRWEPGTGGIRYRILSAGKDTTLALPESLPQ